MAASAAPPCCTTSHRSRVRACLIAKYRSGRTSNRCCGSSPSSWGRTTRQLAAALTISDLRTIAKRRVPLGVFEYTDGAAESEISLRRARQLFRDVQFNPSILRDVADVDTTVSLLGQTRCGAVCVRANRLFADDASRGRARCRSSGGEARDSVRAVDDGHHNDRGRGRCGPRRSQVVSAVCVEGPADSRGLDGPRAGCRLRGAHLDGRCSGRREPVAGTCAPDSRCHPL